MPLAGAFDDCPFQNVAGTVAYWIEVCLYADAIGENPYKNWLVFLSEYFVACDTL